MKIINIVICIMILIIMLAIVMIVREYLSPTTPLIIRLLWLTMCASYGYCYGKIIKNFYNWFNSHIK